MRSNGFTLVELMVVIVVIGLLAGAVVLTVGATTGGPDQAAVRFAGRLAAARDEAIVSGQPISAWVSASGYGFDQYRSGHWQPMSGKPFDVSNWDSGTRIGLPEAASGRVRVRFDGLGMADRPLALPLTRDGRTVVVKVAQGGDVTVE